MALTTSYQSGIDTNILAKVGIPASIPVPIIGNAYKDLAIILDALVGGTLPTTFDTIYKIATELTTIKTLIGAGVTDGDAFINTVTELLAAFSTYPEGVDILTAINSKLAKTDVTTSLVETVAGKAADATVIKTLNDAITSINSQITSILSSLDGKADLDPVDGFVLESQTRVTDIATKIAQGIEEFDDAGTFKMRVDLQYVFYKYLIGYRWGFWSARYNDNNIGTFNTSSATQSGAAGFVAVPLDLTTYWGKIPKMSLTSQTTTANGSLNMRDIKQNFSMQEGFKHEIWFSPTDSLANKRSFYGLTTATAGLAGGTEPSAAVHSAIGIGNDSGDTNLQLISGVSGSLQKLSLGSNFPKGLTDILKIELEAAPGATSFSYTVSRIDKTTGALVGAPATGTSSNVPAQTTGLGRQLFTGNGSTLAASSMEFALWLFELGSDVMIP